MLNQRIQEQTKAFIDGYETVTLTPLNDCFAIETNSLSSFKSIISDNWIRIFSPTELQRYVIVERWC
jgi:hypothetical protein